MNGIFSRFWKFLIWPSPDSQNAWRISQIPGNLGNSKFLSKSEVVYFLRIGNFSNVWLSRKFSKFPEIWGIPQISSHFRNFQVLKNIPFSTSNRIWEISGIPQMPGNHAKFPKYLGIWEIPQIAGNLGNFPNTWGNLRVVYFSSIEHFSNAFFMILEISQMTEHLWNFPYLWISQIARLLRIFLYLKINYP